MSERVHAVCSVAVGLHVFGIVGLGNFRQRFCDDGIKRKIEGHAAELRNMIVGDAEFVPDRLEGIGGIGRDVVVFGEQLVVCRGKEEIHVGERQVGIFGVFVHGDAVGRGQIGVAAVLARGGEDEGIVDAAVIVGFQLGDGAAHGHGARHEGGEADVVRLGVVSLLSGDMQESPGGNLRAALGEAAVFFLRGLVVVIAVRDQIIEELHGFPEILAHARLPAVDPVVDRPVVWRIGHHIADRGVQEPLAEISGVALKRDIAGRPELCTGGEELRPVLGHRNAEARQQRFVDVQAADLRAQRNGIDLRRRVFIAVSIGKVFDQPVERAGKIQLVFLGKQLQRVWKEVRICLQVGGDIKIDAGIRAGKARLH